MSFYLTAIMIGLGLSALAFGVFLTLRIFNFPDITTDGSYTLGAAVTAVLLMQNMSPWLVLPIAFLAGSAAGTITGLIHTKLRVNPLLAGILVMTALYSVNLYIMSQPNIPLIESRSLFGLSTQESDFRDSFITLAAFAVFLLIFITWLLKTDFGLAMRATGSSPQMIKALGVNINRMKIIGLAIANGLIAVSGYLVCQFQGFADINMGIGIVIVGLGSVMIGESLIWLTGSSGIMVKLAGVLCGTLLFRIILAATLTFGMDPNLLKLVTAAIVLLFVGLPLIRNKNNFA